MCVCVCVCVCSYKTESLCYVYLKLAQHCKSTKLKYEIKCFRNWLKGVKATFDSQEEISWETRFDIDK